MKVISSSRREHLLTKACVFLIVAALIAGMVGCVPVSQNLEIRDWYDLDDVRDNLEGSHILMNDLDSTAPGYTELASPTANQGKGWEPIGSWEYGEFIGSFDGQGYEISDMYINRLDANHVGLFGSVDDEGAIQDIGVVNATVTGQMYVGALVGFTRGTVSNSYSTSNVKGGGTIGGLVGWNIEGTVSNSYSTGSVTGHSSVGGLVGKNDEGNVSNSYSTGNTTGDGWVGGLVGINYKGTLSNCYVTTSSVIGNEHVGGLMGTNDQGNVSNSHYNYDEVLINGENIIAIGALFDEDFEEWLANGKFLDINDRLSQEDGYYAVNDVTDFKQLLAFGQDGSLKLRLMNDLDLGDEPNFYIPYLAGEFDGNDHIISNLSFNFDFVSPVGLFGYLTPSGNVADVGVENVNVTGGFVGGLVGINGEGTVSNSYSTGNVTGGEFVGGLVGINLGILSNSYSTGNTTGDGWVGGLVGINYKGTVSASYSTGTVTGAGCVGGLVGENWGHVSKSYSTGSVTGESYVGGLVGGTLLGSVSDSYSIGSVTGNSFVGGLVGHIWEGNVSNSYSTGNVTGVTYVGGLIGENEGEGTISNSFWDTETSGQFTSAGGTGKNTTEMQDIATFTDTETEGLYEPWDITTVVDIGTRNPAYIWNIVDDETYPFLSWQP